VWHLFVVRHPQREALQEHLAKCGVQTLIHYPIPPHKSNAFSPNSGSRFTNLSLPIAEKLANENLSLPIGPHLSEASVDLIGQAMHSFSSR
jgi:dTDP-4-amino-4,6-dideoxygalactose transaminase